jgi:hypothetical protein
VNKARRRFNRLLLALCLLSHFHQGGHRLFRNHQWRQITRRRNKLMTLQSYNSRIQNRNYRLHHRTDLYRALMAGTTIRVTRLAFIRVRLRRRTRIAFGVTMNMSHHLEAAAVLVLLPCFQKIFIARQVTFVTLRIDVRELDGVLFDLFLTRQGFAVAKKLRQRVLLQQCKHIIRRIVRSETT